MRKDNVALDELTETSCCVDDRKDWRVPTLTTLQIAEETLGAGGSGGDGGMVLIKFEWADDHESIEEPEKEQSHRTDS